MTPAPTAHPPHADAPEGADAAPAPFPRGRAPIDDAGRLAWLRLARSRNVGAQTFRRLLNRYPSAERALAALPELAGRGGAGGYEACSPAQAEREMARAEAAGARMLCLGAPDYPAALAAIPDPPAFLWALGDPAAAARPAIAIVGARNASALGLRLARRLAVDLGEAGYAIVSGLARGIDAAAHEAALATGTTAVLAGGVDHVYPPENAALAARIAEEGARLSEAPMGMEPLARHFPRRNRLISGLSRAVVLVEAAERSGTLVTARYALEQGREAMAAPGSPLDPRAAGCNALIRQGAALVRSAEDVIEALGAPRTLGLRETAADFIFDEAVAPAPHPDLADLLIDLLGPSGVEEDALARLTGAPPAELALALLELDLAGRIERRPGGLIARAAADF